MVDGKMQTKRIIFITHEKHMTSNFTMSSQKPVKTVQSIRFEKDISNQNWTPQPPDSLPEYMTEFAGWYTTRGM